MCTLQICVKFRMVTLNYFSKPMVENSNIILKSLDLLWKKILGPQSPFSGYKCKIIIIPSPYLLLSFQLFNTIKLKTKMTCLYWEQLWTLEKYTCYYEKGQGVPCESQSRGRNFPGLGPKPWGPIMNPYSHAVKTKNSWNILLWQ